MVLLTSISKRWNDYFEGFKTVDQLNSGQTKAALNRAIRDIKLLKEELEKTNNISYDVA